jgi:hypothetical protein
MVLWDGTVWYGTRYHYYGNLEVLFSVLWKAVLLPSDRVGGGKLTSGPKARAVIVRLRVITQSYVRNFPCQTLKISKVSLVVMGS